MKGLQIGVLGGFCVVTDIYAEHHTVFLEIQTPEGPQKIEMAKFLEWRMDPDIALKLAEDENLPQEDRLTAIKSLRTWLNNGGFRPKKYRNKSILDIKNLLDKMESEIAC